jgi:hypothetical protein
VGNAIYAKKLFLTLTNNLTAKKDIMIKLLTEKHQKKIAFILFFVFYGELAANAYAGKQQRLAFQAFESSLRRKINYIDDMVHSNHTGNTPFRADYKPEFRKPDIAAEFVPAENAGKKEDDEPFIGGPGQPEMSSFKTVGADNMVNLFSGDFSYNINLLDIDGYPINLFYNAGVTMDQEASWVGLGWNINPGTISRNMRGLPDDYDGVDEIIKEQSMRPDITVGVRGTTGGEFVGTPFGGSLSAGIFYNNRRGLGLEAGASGEMAIHKGLSKKTGDEKTTKDTIKTSVEASLNLNSQEGMSANAGFSITKFSLENGLKWGLSTSIGFSSRQGVTDITIGGESKWYSQQKDKLGDFGKQFSDRQSASISFARSSFTPSIRMPLTRLNQLYVVKLGTEKKVLFKNGTVSGYVNETRIDGSDKVQKKPAYGYMYYEKAQGDRHALMDFNRLNDRVYTYKTPVISVPVYTYDVFSINGQGTGGTFRGYRGNMGYVRDHDTKTKTGSFTLSFDVGGGSIFHGGLMVGGVFSPSMVEEWKSGNRLRQTAAFKTTDSTFQSFYFKNPGEKAIIDEAYYQKMGEDKLMRPYLTNTSTATPSLASGFQVFDKNLNIEKTISVDETTRRIDRDKRAQVITWLTAEEADHVGLDTMIYSYTENVFTPNACNDLSARTPIRRYNPLDPISTYRKRNHLSEIDVLEPGGMKYVYGTPAYQIKQKEVSFSTDVSTTGEFVSYTDENSIKNNKGRDGYFQSETMNGYAHSFLLTAILSPDYMDVGGDGVTDDDLGTAVKFNYTRVDKQRLNGNFWNPYRWRMPAQANMANYNEGLMADKRDNKGLYTYGEKELWYLHSVESKNMVATFRLGARRDGKQVMGENGGVTDLFPGQRKLERIDLYTKADFMKYGANATPIKSVFFKYSYKLCRNFNLNTTTGIYDSSGKLTLDSIWFSYNGNNRQKKNKYVFKYSNVNPDYNSAENDRWGNYKNHNANPKISGNSVPNRDFPFSTQNADSANRYAAAWNLEKVLLPGGGIINVEYEADDYAYVQNKRASQMTEIAGFGLTKTSTPVDKLYTGFEDHRYVFFNLPEPVADNTELGIKYMQDFKQLLLKLWVLMPPGNIGNDAAYESIVVYSTIQSFGLVPTGVGTYNHSLFYVELESTKKGGSPIMETVIQFLKDQLPFRAYPGYEVNGDGALAQLVRSVWGLVSAFTQGVLGLEKTLKIAKRARTVQMDMSFARLNNPDFKKFGGGHRVKRVVIADNWSKMTKKSDLTGLPDSYYGQEYNYTSVQEINRELDTISSGVASYEPGVGNEENPFREVLKYDERQFLGPTNHSNIEMPVAETFFPSPSVGYGKVSVRSIHNKDNKKIKSGIGLQQTEFFTTRDFPVIADFTSFDPNSRHHHKPSFLNKIFKFDQKDYMTLTQGFRVVLNDMNGKMKSQTSYPEDDLSTPINYSVYHYRKVAYGENKFKLDNVLPVVGGPDGKITHKMIGKEIEVMNDFREHFSYTYSVNIPFNAEFFTIAGFPVIIPSIFRMLFRDESMFRSASTLKVVNEFGILDSVENLDKGSRVSTKNLIYDAETGDVLVSRTNNEFDKPVYNFNYPAWWTHTGMEPAYRNIDLTYKNLVFRNGEVGAESEVNMNNFESGDEIFVMDMTEPGGNGPAETDGCIRAGYPAFLPQSDQYRIWAVDVRKDLRNTEKKFIFLDRFGRPYNSANATIRVIRSGKRNMAGSSAGSIVSMSNPVRMRDGVERLIIDDTTDVLNAGAVEYKERWRANDQFYAVDTTLVTVRQATLYPQSIIPYQSYSRERNHEDNYQSMQYSAPMINSFAFETEKRRKLIRHNVFDRERWWSDQNSWIRFNLSSYSNLEGAIIKDAKLNLPAHDSLHNASTGMYLGTHFATQPHRNHKGWDHAEAMRFKISRMTTPWYDPVTQDNQWKNIFPDNTNDDRINDNVLFTPDNVPGQGAFTGSYSVPVTGLAQGMINNYSNPNVAAGIKLSFFQNSDAIDDHDDDQPWRYCFRVFSVGEKFWKGISMDLTYYKCSPSNPVVYPLGGISGAPVTPPPGYEFCREYVTSRFCFSTFTKTQMNPYIQGIIGNFRSFRSYVFYGERREGDPTAQTEINKNGVIKDFEAYWAFGASALTKSNSTKWVWNSEITQYNRKGAELENHDPLNRYNAGIYGYHQSLPVAVVNNSRLRLSAFDGFEDYSYQYEDPCDPFCQPNSRHFNAGVNQLMLVDTQSHTGRYSLRVASNATHQVDVKVSANDSISSPDLLIKTVKTSYSDTSYVPKGNGLLGSYHNNKTLSNFVTSRIDPYVNLSWRGGNNVNTCFDRGNLPDNPGLRCGDISVRWTGKIQVDVTGQYSFNVSCWDNKVWVTINGVLVRRYDNGHYYGPPVTLTAGELYDVNIDFVQERQEACVNLLWKKPGSNSFTTIDPKHFYATGSESLAEGSVVISTQYCEKLDTIQAISHHLVDTFNLIPGKKMVASLWMKQGGQDCKCTNYTNYFRIRDASGVTIGTFQPKERIIEGWQQFEAVFDVPLSGNKIQIDLQAPANEVFIDDLRIHPFNANMKSFVYDPVNLRLAAELDENNYASFYEYDDEGTLIRVKKETRLGIKTITETRSSLQKSISDF